MNNNDYLKTPEHFKMLVESKVNEQLNTPISDKKKPTTSIQAKKEKSGYHFKKIAAAAAVIAIITTTSVFAAKHFRLATILKAAQKHTTKAIWKPLITATYLSKTVFLNK